MIPHMGVVQNQYMRKHMELHSLGITSHHQERFLRFPIQTALQYMRPEDPGVIFQLFPCAGSE